jgi:AraC-like DNA-binding protein
MATTVLQDHDQTSGSVDGSSVEGVVSSVLDAVRLTAAMFFLVHVTPPWLTKAPHADTFAPLVLPRSRGLVSYHVVTRGSCWAGLTGDRPERLEAGDVLVVPHGDSYFLTNDAATDAASGPAVEAGFFEAMAAGRLPPVIGTPSDDAEGASFLCGFLGYDVTPKNPLIASLPPVVHLRSGVRGAGEDAMAHLVALALAEIRERRTGERSALLRISELMFVELLRRQLESRVAEPGGPRGWLAGLRDPLVARMLVAIHDEPARGWTIESVAAAAGTSRTVAAERFAAIVGQPPMQYLTQWRMQLAARLLRDRSKKVLAVAEAVGYGSEAAFSRAFKKVVGVSPATFRADDA